MYMYQKYINTTSQRKEDAWLSKYIHSFIPLNAPWAGCMESLKNYLNPIHEFYHKVVLYKYIYHMIL